MTDYRTLTVDLGARRYPIHIGDNLISRLNALVPGLDGRKIFLLYDRAVEIHAQKLKTTLTTLTGELALEGGEKTKSYDGLQKVLNWLLENRVDRKSILIVMGGGVIGDLGGFAASIVLRGIPFIQIPTTVLAQVDSSVGGKTGINTAQGKNLVGTFYQPMAVLCDTETLSTLPEREIKAGYAEILKYALLGDRSFFEWLDQNGPDVIGLKSAPLVYAVEKSCTMKAAIVGQDEREESGQRALLNLGHTFGHALEAAAGYDGRLLHGEAVSIGMVLAFRLSVAMGLCAQEDAGAVEANLKKCGLKTEIAEIIPALNCSAEDLVERMSHDKKVANGSIHFILLNGIGSAFQTSGVDKTLLMKILETRLI